VFFLLLLAAGGSLAALAGLLVFGTSPPSTSAPTATTRQQAAAVAVFALGVLPAIMFGAGRIGMEQRLNWRVQGQIVEKYTCDHGASCLKVRNAAGRVIELRQVAPTFWAEARVGDAIQKDAGCPDALLNGRRLRILRTPRWPPLKNCLEP
jgi:hypothetical protein